MPFGIIFSETARLLHRGTTRSIALPIRSLPFFLDGSYVVQKPVTFCHILDKNGFEITFCLPTVCLKTNDSDDEDDLDSEEIEERQKQMIKFKII